MKEIKTFFASDNRLNKGYARTTNHPQSDTSLYRKKFEQILPPIDLISQYEDINPGTLAKLTAMTEKEQAHKHELEKKLIDEQAKAIKLGQLFGSISLVTICTTIAVSLLASNLKLVAYVLGAVIISLVLILYFVQRKSKTLTDHVVKNTEKPNSTIYRPHSKPRVRFRPKK